MGRSYGICLLGLAIIGICFCTACSSEKEAALSDTDKNLIVAYDDTGGNCLLTEKERENLQKDALTEARECAGFYSGIENASQDGRLPSTSADGSTEEERAGIVDLLGKRGLVSVSADINMTNYKRVEEFYSSYSSGREAQVTIYEPFSDGTFSSKTFVCRDGKLQSYYIGIKWKKGAKPVIESTSAKNISELKLTDKGYLLYANEVLSTHGNKKEHYRVKPLSDECRELTRKYVSGLNYLGYNVLSGDWDSNNVADILCPRMFEDIYHIYTGEILRPADERIPADIYEEIMTTCFPATTEQVRQSCQYDSSTHSYPYERNLANPLAPFAEVTDYKDNGDGTLLLYVDAVWPNRDTDCAFTNQLVVQPLENGKFRYLSNVIQAQELELSSMKK